RKRLRLAGGVPGLPPGTPSECCAKRYFGGGGTRHAARFWLPDVSVTSRMASPLIVRCEVMTPGPGRLSFGVAPGACGIFTVSSGANGSEQNALALSQTTTDATPTLSDASS